MTTKSHVTQYIRSIRKTYRSGSTTEHSYRSALEALLETLEGNIKAVNEPGQREFGAPDLIAKLGTTTIGYIECKGLHVSLDDVENSPQLIRYRKNCKNLILTNYHEFRWYRNEERVGEPVIIAELVDGEIRSDSKNYEELCDLFLRFRFATPVEVFSSEELVMTMAVLTREIAEQIINVLSTPDENSFLHKHKRELEAELLPKLKAAEFADMYAQTLTFALFTARVHHQGRPEEFTLRNAFFDMPSTNPFLHREFRTIVDQLDENVQGAVDQLAKHFRHTRIDDVLSGFGRRTERRDPVIHLYEDFLASYDPEQRGRRGVYFTPDPVVDFIVRGVDELLRNRFNRIQGLACSSVQVLDPATGTGSFLLKIFECIYESMRSRRGIWQDYVRNHMLPRVFGFELLMAPYTLAHLRLGTALKEMGFELQQGERLGIYLTNSLEEGKKKEGELWENHIVAEANAAAEVKNEKPIMVVIGNPPYSGSTANKNKWINDKLQSYKEIQGVKVKILGRGWRDDDYVKFIRFGQWRIEQTGEGILAFITNHGFIDNLSFPVMRQSLLNCFNEIYILDLHGNINKSESAPNGSKDENVFDIQQGVSVAFFVKHNDRKGPARVFHADLWGLRDEKYSALYDLCIEGSHWQEIEPEAPFYFLEPFDYEGWNKYDEQGWNITEIFPKHSTGMVTGRDPFVLDFDYEVLRERFLKTRDLRIESDEIRRLVKGYILKDKPHWLLDPSRESIHKEEDWEQFFEQCLYRPFDVRHIFYHDAFVWRRRNDIMQHMQRNLNDTTGNLALVTTRQKSQSGPWTLCGVADTLVESCYISNKTKEINHVFPLYLLDWALVNNEPFPSLHSSDRRPNLSREFVSDCEAKLDLRFVSEATGEPGTFSPEDVFYYIYAIFHSQKYRERYAEFLQIDFPRVPLTTSVPLFCQLSALGAELIDWHLLKHKDLESENGPTISFLGKGNSLVSNQNDFPFFSETKQRVYINKTKYFEGVSFELWRHMIGGYQVLKKWLSDRKGRTLKYKEIVDFQHVVRSLSETQRLMREIDEAIGDFPLP